MNRKQFIGSLALGIFAGPKLLAEISKVKRDLPQPIERIGNARIFPISDAQRYCQPMDILEFYPDSHLKTRLGIGYVSGIRGGIPSFTPFEGTTDGARWCVLIGSAFQEGQFRKERAREFKMEHERHMLGFDELHRALI